MKVQRWEEILKRGVSGYVILLDVDGTLLPDGEREVSEKIKGYIETLKKDNKVYLLSNSGTKGRVGRVSSELNIPRLETPYKKPNPAIKRALPQNGMPILVIGDKLMIDGILAMLIGAELLIMKRERSPKDRWFVSFGYFCEDLLFSIFKFFIRR